MKGNCRSHIRIYPTLSAAIVVFLVWGIFFNSHGDLPGSVRLAWAADRFIRSDFKGCSGANCSITNFQIDASAAGKRLLIVEVTTKPNANINSILVNGVDVSLSVNSNVYTNPVPGVGTIAIAEVFNADLPLASNNYTITVNTSISCNITIGAILFDNMKQVVGFGDGGTSCSSCGNISRSVAGQAPGSLYVDAAFTDSAIAGFGNAQGYNPVWKADSGSSSGGGGYTYVDKSGNITGGYSFGATVANSLYYSVVLQPYPELHGAGLEVYGDFRDDNDGTNNSFSDGYLSCKTEGDCTFDYQVAINDNHNGTANINGCAATSIGILCFDTYDRPPLPPFYSAEYNIRTGTTSGWARFCNMADDQLDCYHGDGGWVQMSGAGYGVTVATTSGMFLRGHAYNDSAYGNYGYLSFNCQDGYTPALADDNYCDTDSYKSLIVPNIRGYAWSGTGGWVSFNCVDGGNGQTNVCGDSPYGVQLDQVTDILSGYAWSSNLGWISFQEPVPVSLPGIGNMHTTISSNCDSACVPANGCSACVDPDDPSGRVYGWGKVLAFGDDGWVRLDDDPGDGQSYGVSFDSVNNYFLGQGWQGAPGGFGYITWNCETLGVCGSNPGDSQFAVKLDVSGSFASNNPPEAYDLAATMQGSQCSPGRSVRSWIFNWKYKDSDSDPEEFYRIMIGTDPSNPSGEELDSTECENSDYPSGGCKITIPSSGVDHNYPFTFSNSSYGRTFYYWVQVGDDQGSPSAWVKGTNPPSISIPANEFPDVYFTWIPKNFSINEEVSFTSEALTQYYTGDTASKCSDHPGTCMYNWTTDGTPDIDIISPSSASTTVIVTKQLTGKSIFLQVTEPGGQFCSTSTSAFAPKVPLPSWIEIN